MDLLEKMRKKRFLRKNPDRCGNCHEKMRPEDKYCAFCGTQRGQGSFHPYVNQRLYAYGPPVKRKYKCEKCGHLIKPDVVLYEEGLDNDTIQGAVSAISRAQVLIVGGTSLVVYPAAGLIRYFGGDKIVLLNKGQTSLDSQADLAISAPIST